MCWAVSCARDIQRAHQSSPSSKQSVSPSLYRWRSRDSERLSNLPQVVRCGGQSRDSDPGRANLEAGTPDAHTVAAWSAESGGTPAGETPLLGGSCEHRGRGPSEDRGFLENRRGGEGSGNGGQHRRLPALLGGSRAGFSLVDTTLKLSQRRRPAPSHLPGLSLRQRAESARSRTTWCPG